MASSNPQIQTRFEKAGLTMLSPRLGIQLLAEAMKVMTHSCTPVLAEITWSKLFRQEVPPLFSEVIEGSKLGLPASRAGGAAQRPALDGIDIQKRVKAIAGGMLGGDIAPDQVKQTMKDLRRESA